MLDGEADRMIAKLFDSLAWFQLVFYMAALEFRDGSERRPQCGLIHVNKTSTATPTT